MTDKQRETLAKMEGIQVVKARDTNVVLFYRGQGGSLREVFPNYESHDDIQRVIDGLSEEAFMRYVAKLSIVCGNPSPYAMILKATPAQKCEAVLRTVGKWEE